MHLQTFVIATPSPNLRSTIALPPAKLSDQAPYQIKAKATAKAKSTSLPISHHTYKYRLSTIINAKGEHIIALALPKDLAQPHPHLLSFHATSSYQAPSSSPMGHGIWYIVCLRFCTVNTPRRLRTKSFFVVIVFAQIKPKFQTPSLKMS